jgi:hypothetical protein
VSLILVPIGSWKGIDGACNPSLYLLKASLLILTKVVNLTGNVNRLLANWGWIWSKCYLSWHFCFSEENQRWEVVHWECIGVNSAFSCVVWWSSSSTFNWFSERSHPSYFAVNNLENDLIKKQHGDFLNCYFYFVSNKWQIEDSHYVIDVLIFFNCPIHEEWIAVTCCFDFIHFQFQWVVAYVFHVKCKFRMKKKNTMFGLGKSKYYLLQLNFSNSRLQSSPRRKKLSIFFITFCSSAANVTRSLIRTKCM